MEQRCGKHFRVDLAQKHVNNIQTSIRERNNYSKKEITRHFQHLNRENHNRIVHGKSELEGELPVFCVSTKAYQKLQGRLQKNEPKVAGFTELEQTEIPQLQAHCIRLTERPREASSKLFLIKLKKLLQSMLLWSSATGSAYVLSDAKKQEMEAGYIEAVTEMEKASILPPPIDTKLTISGNARIARSTLC
jgi:hypothetical protein